MSDPTKHVCATCDGKPGSDSARDEGCTCPAIDNHFGHSRAGLYIISGDCPLHGDDAN